MIPSLLANSLCIKILAFSIKNIFVTKQKFLSRSNENCFQPPAPPRTNDTTINAVVVADAVVDDDFG